MIFFGNLWAGYVYKDELIHEADLLLLHASVLMQSLRHCKTRMFDDVSVIDYLINLEI